MTPFPCSPMHVIHSNIPNARYGNPDPNRSVLLANRTTFHWPSPDSDSVHREQHSFAR